MAKYRESSKPVGTVMSLWLLTACVLGGRWLPASSPDDEFNRSVQIIVETLNFLGEEELANQLLIDVKEKRVILGRLDSGQNAQTGTRNLLGIGENEMTLDDDVLALGRSEKLWKKKKFESALNYLSWAETIDHEYVHMKQTDPKNLPKFEDPAYLHIAKTHVRWFNRLYKMFAMIADDEKDLKVKTIKLRGLKGIMTQLYALQGTFKESVDAKIQDHTLNPHLPFANKGLDVLIQSALKQIDAELKTTEAQLASGKTGTPADTTSPPPVNRPGWHQDGAPHIEKTIPEPDACYPSASLDITTGAATGTRAWVDCSNATKCSGSYVGKVTWTNPPAFMEPGQAIRLDATAGTTAQNTCGYRNFSSWVAVKLNGSTVVNAGESKYSGPPQATGTLTVPVGQPGARLTIEVILHAASLSGKVVYSYVYR